MTDRELAFEESLSEDWARDIQVTEVPLNNRPLFYLGIGATLISILVAGRIVFLSYAKGDIYKARAENNVGHIYVKPPPRGIIYDRYGKVLAQNIPTFRAVLNVKEFLSDENLKEETVKTVSDILGMDRNKLWQIIGQTISEYSSGPIVLEISLTQNQVVKLKSTDLKTISVENSFGRSYPDGNAFSSVIGYTSIATPDDLEKNPNLTIRDFVGKTGVEAHYDLNLQGQPGIIVQIVDAKGNILNSEEKTEPKTGKPLNLTIDAELQKYFYERMKAALTSLGRTSGVGLAINPQNGEILALISFPTYDNNLFSTRGQNEEKQKILTSISKPLFNRVVNGLYNPGSTIKPMVGVAALSEGVISPTKTIFSPGYIDIPNPYDPEKPTRYPDWRYQGDVNLGSAIAQSSNVYFYVVGGGGLDIKGLGITRLHEWWEKFKFGVATGIDLPGEKKGFLPTPDWKEKNSGRPWTLGDTYNVSIGQGDLLLTPLQLLNYISAIGNGGTIYEPVVNKDVSHGKILADLTYLTPEITEVQKGMRKTVTSPIGTAHILDDLLIEIGAKTGSAQVQNNSQENAFFVGYAPFDNPEIAILVLVENSREGSLNAVPIAKEVLNWYYQNRIRK
jgi:penicillin-binding protein 2